MSSSDETWRRHHRPCPSATIVSALSTDLITLILDRLADSSDIKSCRLVSRAFYRAELLHRRAIRLLRPDPLPLLLRRYPSLHTLDLSVCPSLDDATLASASSAAPLLRFVNLSRTTGVGWRGLEAMVSCCRRLEGVNLSHCLCFGDREAAALAGAVGLRELRLDKCLGVTDVGLANVAVGCSKMERLGIKWCMEISDIGIDLLTKKCRELKELDISYLKVTNASLYSISSLGKLQVLSMIGCPYIDDKGLGFLNTGGISLQSMDVSRCDSVSSCGLISTIESHKRLQKLYAGDCFPELSPVFLSKFGGLKTNLNKFKLSGFRVTTSSLQIISTSCKNLLEIGLSKCLGVTDDGISVLVSNCTDLKMIDLTCCCLVSDTALFSMASCCKKLVSLQLESCALITEKGLCQIATCCSYLQEIDLTDCGIIDTELKCLSKCIELMVLKLGLCSYISDKGLVHIASNCRKLQELDLYRCVKITDDGMAAIAGGCKKLKKLNICYCSKITDQGMEHLGHLKELSDLEMRSLIQVTDVGIKAIGSGCKNLTELDLKHCYSVDDMGLSALGQYLKNLRQINVSYCSVSDMGLCQLLGSLRCLQDVKLVHLTYVSVQGFEIALRASCSQLRKLKLLIGLRHLLSPGLLQMLRARGCRIRWVNKQPIVRPYGGDSRTGEPMHIMQYFN